MSEQTSRAKSTKVSSYRPDSVRLFRVKSVEKCEAPGSEPSDGWYCYVVENQLTQIKGFARGKKGEVESHAERFVAQLNARNDPNAKLSYARPGRKPAAATR